MHRVSLPDLFCALLPEKIGDLLHPLLGAMEEVDLRGMRNALARATISSGTRTATLPLTLSAGLSAKSSRAAALIGPNPAGARAVLGRGPGK